MITLTRDSWFNLCSMKNNLWLGQNRNFENKVFLVNSTRLSIKGMNFNTSEPNMTVHINSWIVMINHGLSLWETVYFASWLWLVLENFCTPWKCRPESKNFFKKNWTPLKPRQQNFVNLGWTAFFREFHSFSVCLKILVE